MPEQRQGNGGLGFFAMVGGVMALLKLKERWDDYKQVSQEDEGRVALGTAPAYHDADEESTGLLDTSLPTRRPTRPKRKECCMCCGMNCGLFWKAFGIVVGLLVLWNTVKFIKWMVTPSLTGLEGMPKFSTSLGCLNAPHIYNGSQVNFEAVVGFEYAEHSVDLRGAAPGTVTLVKGSADDDKIRYEMTLRTDDESLLKQVLVRYPDGEDGSRLVINTPEPAAEATSCSRFDLKMYIPRNLKKLHLTSHTPAHIQFDTESSINLENLFINVFSMDTNNQIIPNTKMHAADMKLQLVRGWIVGEVSVVNQTSINTQDGDGVANIVVRPTPYRSNAGVEFPVSVFETATGAGRTNIFYESDPAFQHRPIQADHISARNGDMYLTYRKSEFSGKVKLISKSFTATGLNKLTEPDEEGYTHYVGDQDGGDIITVNSRGWTGLYF